MRCADLGVSRNFYYLCDATAAFPLRHKTDRTPFGPRRDTVSRTKNDPVRIDPTYEIREIAGEHVVIVQGRHGADMTRVIAFNDSARYLWEALRRREFTPEEAARLLTERFEVDEATALRDAEAWIGKLRDCGILRMQ